MSMFQGDCHDFKVPDQVIELDYRNVHKTIFSTSSSHDNWLAAGFTSSSFLRSLLLLGLRLVNISLQCDLIRSSSNQTLIQFSVCGYTRLTSSLGVSKCTSFRLNDASIFSNKVMQLGSRLAERAGR